MAFYREGYRFVPWRQAPKQEWDEEQGVKPALPEHIHYELLAFMGHDSVSEASNPALHLVRRPKDVPKISKHE